MIELRRVIEAWEAAEREGVPLVLATVVKVAGSTYRRPGARLLCSAERWLAGAVSGGCLEGDVLKKAFWRTAAGRPAVASYDSRTDDDLAWSLGLGCNGLVDVLLERLDPARKVHPLRTIAAWRRAGVRGLLATVISAPDGAARPGDRLAIGPGSDLRSELPAGPLAAALEDAGRAALGDGKSRGVRLEVEGGGVAEVFLEVVRPAPRVVLFGDGHDVPPLVALLRGVGWHVTVVATRRAPSTGPGAAAPDALVVCSPGAARDRVPVDAETAAVVMTHSFAHDRELLGALLASPAWYVGVLGPRRRTERLLAEASPEGAPPGRAAALRAPVGLDLGAEGADEIALAIAAELVAARAGRAGGPLRDRAGALHEVTP